MDRWTSGEVTALSRQPGWVRIPHGLPQDTHSGPEVGHFVWGEDDVGSSPTCETRNKRPQDVHGRIPVCLTGRVGSLPTEVAKKQGSKVFMDARMPVTHEESGSLPAGTAKTLLTQREMRSPKIAT